MTEQNGTAPEGVVNPTEAPGVKITLADLIMDEIRLAVKVSQKYDELIKSAKTQTKRSFYLKKLKANNEFVMKALVALDQHKAIKNAEMKPEEFADQTDSQQ